MIQENLLPFIWGDSLWEALFVVSQKWVPFPATLDSPCSQLCVSRQVTRKEREDERQINRQKVRRSAKSRAGVDMGATQATKDRDTIF